MFAGAQSQPISQQKANLPSPALTCWPVDQTKLCLPQRTDLFFFVSSLSGRNAHRRAAKRRKLHGPGSRHDRSSGTSCKTTMRAVDSGGVDFPLLSRSILPVCSPGELVGLLLSAMVVLFDLETWQQGYRGVGGRFRLRPTHSPGSATCGSDCRSG